MVAPARPTRPGFARRMGQIFNRAMATVSYRIHVASANTWRDQYNPLRHLSITRAISLLEEGERGAFSDLQWTYRFIEMQDSTLGALIERRTSAIQELEWNIKTRDDVPAGKEAIAKLQHDALKDGYDKVGNFSESLENLALASFRGFTRLEKVENKAGDVIELAGVDQWFWVRKGLYGAWQRNPDAKFGTNEGEDVPASRFITREVARPINRVALIAFVRKGLSQKDWDGFIESYGIPAVFLIMPPDVPKDQEDEYFDTADSVVSDGRGALPHGSDVKTVDNGARGNNPFKDHIAYQDEQIVMRGTGGLLTMLTQSGSGTLAGNAHADTFAAIAKAEAKEISEILRKQFDSDIIARVTPGEPAYAYFELAAIEKADTAAVVRDVSTLKRSGFNVSAAHVSERTGYEVTEAATPGTTPASRLLNRILNRAAAEDAADPEWVPFARETGTLGIPRSIMPQIQSGNRAAMVNSLKKHGVDYVKKWIKPSDLKPTQAEYSPAKVEKANSYEGTPRAILVSSDNHVLDGHHQYLSALHKSPNTPIPVFKIKAPAMHALGLMLRLPSTGQEETPIHNRLDDEIPVIPTPQTAAMNEARTALAEDQRPLCDALFSAFKTKDSSAFTGALKKISKDLPDFAAVPAFEAWLSSEMVKAWMGEPETETDS